MQRLKHFFSMFFCVFEWKLSILMRFLYAIVQSLSYPMNCFNYAMHVIYVIIRHWNFRFPSVSISNPEVLTGFYLQQFSLFSDNFWQFWFFRKIIRFIYFSLFYLCTSYFIFFYCCFIVVLNETIVIFCYTYFILFLYVLFYKTSVFLID